VAALCII